MTVSEIIEQIRGQYGQRHQLTETQALLILNDIQRRAMDKDLDAFLYYDNFLTVDSEEGPYSFPADPPCRKFRGLTKLTKSQLLRYSNYSNNVDQLYPSESDYGIRESSLIDRRNTYLPVEINMMDREFTCLFEPDASEENLYRIVYWRKPKTIRSTQDDGRLLIPEEYHYSICVQASVRLADFFINGAEVPPNYFDQYFKPWWGVLTGGTDPNDKGWISEGQVGP